MANPRNVLLPGFRQQTLLDAGVAPTCDLQAVEATECRALWARRTIVKAPAFDGLVDAVQKRERQRRAVGL